MLTIQSDPHCLRQPGKVFVQAGACLQIPGLCGEWLNFNAQVIEQAEDHIVCFS